MECVGVRSVLMSVSVKYCVVSADTAACVLLFSLVFLQKVNLNAFVSLNFTEKVLNVLLFVLYSKMENIQ